MAILTSFDANDNLTFVSLLVIQSLKQLG